MSDNMDLIDDLFVQAAEDFSKSSNVMEMINSMEVVSKSDVIDEQASQPNWYKNMLERQQADKPVAVFDLVEYLEHDNSTANITSETVSFDTLERGNLQKYQEMLDKNCSFTQTFSGVDYYQNLSAYDGEIQIYMRNVNITGQKERFEEAELLTTEFVVKVMSIDYENKRVNVYCKEEDVTPRRLAINKINEALGNGKKVHVQGIIRRVTDYQAGDHKEQDVYIDIFGQNIQGRISIKNWANAYTPNIKAEATIGTTVDVLIYRKTTYVQKGNGRIRITKKNEDLYRTARKDVIYECSRSDYLKLVNYDPWDSVVKNLRQHQTVGFTVVSSDKRKKTFFASIDGIPNFNVLGNYPDNMAYVPVNGRFYGFIDKLKPETRYCHVRILGRLEPGSDYIPDADSLEA